MIFLTILGVTEILCSFRLILEKKRGKEISESSRLELLERFLADNFALWKHNPSGLLNREDIADLPSRFNSPKVLRTNFLGSDEFFLF